MTEKKEERKIKVPEVPEVEKKRVKLRLSSGSADVDYSSFEVTVPREIIDREARRHGIENTYEEILENLRPIWIFNDFDGSHLFFEKKKEVKK